MILEKNHKSLKNQKNAMTKNGKDSFIDNERINTDDKGAIALERVDKLYVVLGWISAALTVFVTPLFAIAGITFGVLLNKQQKGSGNVIIISNVVLALINIVLSQVFLMLINNMIYR